MPATIPGLGAVKGYLALQAIAHGTSAVSVEADTLRKSATDVIRAAERSVSLFGEKSKAIDEILALADECSVEGWDGYGAAPVDGSAVELATDFIRALPEAIPLAEFSVDPDGAISMDWAVNPSRVFSLSIGASDRLAYAWLDGTDKGHAVARFDGIQVPRRILEGIQAFTYDSSSIWTF